MIQAGSPGANEYSGHKEYMRDEVALPNVAGSVGLSIRGSNTADAQFYVNLVDNARLDRGYTIFAHVFGEDMDVPWHDRGGRRDAEDHVNRVSGAEGQITGASSSFSVPASASISTSTPSGSVHCGCEWPIIAPCQAGTPSGLMWSAKISSSVSAP